MEKWNCIWVATYIDKSALLKIFYFLKGFVKTLFYLPSTKIVHIHLSESTSAKRKNIFFTIAKFFNKKCVVHFHSFSPETTINGSDSKLYNSIFNKADKIIALSNYWKDEIIRTVEDSSKIEVLYNPCPEVNIRPELKKEKEILYAGTLNKRKGYKDLIRAFAKIANKHKDWNLVFAGNGEINKGVALSESLGIKGQVDFEGWVSGRDKERLFNRAMIFCLPSYAEGFPMAVLDAWAYHLPVITTPVGGLPDVLLNGNNALVFNPGDIETLCYNLELAMSDIELRNKLSKASSELSNTTFNLNNIAGELDRIYTTLVNDDKH